MKPGNILDKIIAPCPKCPYKLGHIQALDNPCPACKLDGYSAYKMFTEKLGPCK